jgi:hypothetical protein
LRRLATYTSGTRLWIFVHQPLAWRRSEGVGVEEAERQTPSAILAKAAVIYQAPLKDERFAGFADFLIRRIGVLLTDHFLLLVC